MERIPKWLLLFGFAIIFSLGIPTKVCAQGEDPGCDPVDNTYPDGTPCPIDGGLTALLMIGAGLGIKKIHDDRKNRTVSTH
jgi:hypothetical protein